MSFLGANVTLEGFFPNLSVLRMVPQTVTVGDGVEFPDIAQWDLPDEVGLVNTDIDIGATTISTIIDQPGFSYANGQLPDIQLFDGEFNGLVFSFDLPNNSIVGASLRLNELNLPKDGLFFNDSSIFINAEGLPIGDGDRLEIDVSFLDSSPQMVAFEDAVFTARMYSAALGREPDQPGLNFWITNYNEVGRVGMSDFFLESKEFKDNFGDADTLTDSQYLNVLYNNILGRDGDEDGVAFWLGVLAEQTATKSEVLAYFVDSEENVTNTQEFENVGISAQNGEWVLLM